jgi:hypothetical protein
MGAVETIEKVDSGKLRVLAQRGTKIPGATTMVYLKVEESK